MLKRFASVIFLLAMLAAPGLGQKPTALPAPPPPAPPKTQLKVGQPAPDFTLTDTEGKSVSLHDFKGKKNVVLAFYVLAFTGG